MSKHILYRVVNAEDRTRVYDSIYDDKERAYEAARFWANQYQVRTVVLSMERDTKPTGY